MTVTALNTTNHPRPLPHPWRPVASSGYSRRPGEACDGHGDGILVAGASPHAIHCESLLEHSSAYVLLAQPGVIDLFEQPKPVKYVLEGVVHYHTFDFLAIRSDGKRYAIFVKPSDIVIQKKLDQFVAHLAPQIPRSFAAGVKLITEKHISRDVLHDAVLIHDMRRHDDPEADAALADIAAHLNGATTIRTLVNVSGLGARGFAAVVRLIGSGRLALTNSRRIVHEAMVRRTSLMSGGLAQ